MSDIRTPSAGASLVPQSRVSAPGPSETVRAAQRAFFEAALAGTPTSPAQPIKAAAPTLLGQAPSAAPGRPLRPGSLLDIKV